MIRSQAKYFLFFFFVVLASTPGMAQNTLDEIISISIKKTSLEDALYLLMDETDINLTFSNDLIPTKLISLNLKDQSIKVVLTTLLRDTGLGYKEIGNQVVLYELPKEKKKNRYSISGFIEDRESGERLIGATVWDLLTGKGTTSNAYGFFSLTLEEGEADISFSFVGYENLQTKFNLMEHQRLMIKLNQSVTLPEIDVYATDSNLIEIPTGISATIISSQDIEQIPSLGGEADLSRFTHLLPAVKTGTDGLGGLYIRGGNAGQNLILIDGVPVYDFGHAGGLFSIVNPIAINQASLITGGFPARYSGRISSILDIRTKDGNKYDFKGRLDLSPLSGRLSLEGPILKGKSSFFFSGRKSYLNWYITPLAEKYKADKDEIGTTSFDFDDFNVKINHEISSKDRLFLSFFRGRDAFQNRGNQVDWLVYPFKDEWLKRDQGYSDAWNWSNSTGSLKWNHVFNSKLFSNTTFTYSNLRVNNIATESDLVIHQRNDSVLVKDFSYNRFESAIEDIGGNFNLEYFPGPSHHIRFGTGLVHHYLTPGVLTFEESTEYLENTFSNNPQQALELGAFLEDEFSVTPDIFMNAGLSFVTWNTGNHNYFSWQPRFSIYWSLGPNFGLKASFSEMAQFIHRLSQYSIGLPSDLWVASTSKTPPQTSRQFSFGLDIPADENLSIEIEGYYKKMDNLLNYTEGASFLNNWENNVTPGKGEAYGGELLVKKDKGNFTGWLSYTLSWSYRQFDRINFGNRFPFEFDRRHDLKINIRQKIYKWLDFSATWIYNSGFATSIPTESYVVIIPDNQPGTPTGVIAKNFGPKNNFRMPDYHRLDIALQASFKLLETDHVLGIGAYNLYDRRNPIYYRLKHDYSYEQGYLEIAKKEYVQAWLIPFLPYVNYSIKF